MDEFPFILMKTVYNLQLSIIVFLNKPLTQKKVSATPLHEFKEPFKKLFSSQNAFLIISSEEKKKKAEKS